MRLLKSLIYLYLVVGLAFGIARFGWGAVVAAMAEPEESAFVAGVMTSAGGSAIRVIDWAPTLVDQVVLGGGDFFEWMLYR